MASYRIEAKRKRESRDRNTEYEKKLAELKKFCFSTPKEPLSSMENLVKNFRFP